VGTIYRRGNKLWAKYKGPDGAWSYTSTGLAVGQEAAARKILDLVEAQVAAGRAPEPQPPNPNWTPAPRRGLTVAEWFDTWRPRREKMRSWYHERGRFTAYILPDLGSLRLEEVRTRHLTAFIRRLRETLFVWHVHYLATSRSARRGAEPSPGRSPGWPGVCFTPLRRAKM